MINYITKEFSEAASPVSSKAWREKSKKDRIDQIVKIINTDKSFENFEVIEADDNGQVILKIEKTIPASKRGVILLKLEEVLKNSIEKSINLWLEPVGDKSKLRNLRGIKFKSVENIYSNSIQKFQNNSVEPKRKLILDSHKLSYHYDRVEAWENGERIAPVSVDMALTRACGAMCSFCYAMVQEPQERSSIKVKQALDLVDDFAEVGIKGVSLISDGESTLSKALYALSSTLPM